MQHNSKSEDLFCGALFGTEPNLLFSNYLFGFWFEPIQDGFHHDCARMTDEANSSVGLGSVVLGCPF